MKEEYRIIFCISQLRWAYRNIPEISEMSNKWIYNSINMIKQKRAKVCNYPKLAYIYICLFEKEIYYREMNKNKRGEINESD